MFGYMVEQFKTHLNDTYREMVGRVAVIHLEALNDLSELNYDGFASGYGEACRLQDSLNDLMGKNNDWCSGARKQMRMLVEFMWQPALNTMEGVRSARSDVSAYHLEFPPDVVENMQPYRPIEADGDALRLLGDYAGYYAYCVSDHDLMQTAIRDYFRGHDERKTGAMDRAWGFYRMLEDMATVQVELATTLDAGQTAPHDPVAHTFGIMVSHVRTIRSDMDRMCESIEVEPPATPEWFQEAGTPPEACREERLGRLLISYAAGVSAMRRRKPDVHAFADSYWSIERLVRGTGTFNMMGVAGHTLVSDSVRDTGDTPVMPSKVGRALKYLLVECGQARMRTPIFEILDAVAADRRSTPVQMGLEVAPTQELDTTILERLGLLAGEYAAMKYEARILGRSIFTHESEYRLDRRRESTAGLLCALVLECDGAQVPDDAEIVVTLNFVASDIKAAAAPRAGRRRGNRRRAA